MNVNSRAKTYNRRSLRERPCAKLHIRAINCIDRLSGVSVQNSSLPLYIAVLFNLFILRGKQEDCVRTRAYEKKKEKEKEQEEGEEEKEEDEKRIR